MHWPSTNLQWLIGIAVAAIATIIALFQLKGSGQNDTNATIKNLTLDSSPIATGSGITQTVSVTENHYHGEAHAQPSEDPSRWPDVILECMWPSLIHEPRIPGSHVVRKRPWMLRHQTGGAVYNVQIRDINFGAYKACFPFPVPTLTDAVPVYPIVVQKADGLVVTIHDLESLIHHPPQGCDVEQYATETSGNGDDEEGQLEPFLLEVEIPVTVSYDDKNGNRFKIKYLLHYDIYSEKGQMMRVSGIEKVALK
jgi:hypothetical protein